MFEEIARQLDDILDQEREGIDRRRAEARESGDKRRAGRRRPRAANGASSSTSCRATFPAASPSSSSTTGWTTTALQQFEQLLDDLRKQLLDNMFNQMSQGLSEMSPEQLARMKDMMAELNQMLEQRERGEEPDFDGFMERHGEFFPGNPQNLDELLEQMAQSMAQMQQLLNSMSPEQRAQLMQLSEPLLEDMDLRWQVDELVQQPATGVPANGVGPGHERSAATSPCR